VPTREARRAKLLLERDIEIMRRLLSHSILTAIVATSAGRAFSSEPSVSQLFVLSSSSMKVSDVLTQISANFNVPIVSSPKIDDRYSGEVRGTNPSDILNTLARTYDLIWYKDGHIIYVYKSSETASTILTLTGQKPSEIASYLDSVGVLEGSSCSALPMDRMGSLQISGAPACVERVKQVLDAYDQQQTTTANTTQTIEVFPLTYASASDVTYAYRGQNIVVAGVVTELREMAQSNSLPTTSREISIASQTSAVLAGTLTGDSMRQAPSDTTAVEAPTRQSAGWQPQFSADVRRNAVMVRDYPANMPLYRYLLAQLDKRPAQVEISVVVMDVDESNLEDLGLDLGISANVGVGRVSVNSALQAGNSFSGVLGNSNDFLVKITALEQISKAKILSRPSVLTLDNMKAILDRNVTFYTKLQGRDVAQLASVAAGSLLQVTPRLIEENHQQEVMLSLDVNDGQQGAPDDAVEGLPQVNNSSLTTQAILTSGQSLLLGGFVRDSESSGERRIPWLSDIPVLGALFRSHSTQRDHVVRLFLIKARPVSLSQVAEGEHLD
jgi:type III secretion protein C